MFRGMRFVAAAVALVTLAGCSLLGSDEPESESVSHPTASAPTADLTRYYRQTVDWSACGKHFRCARVTVPLDYSHPDTSDLQLSVVRRPASGKRMGSLLVNPGGPGVSGVDYARVTAAVVTPAVQAAYDIVGFDPRGVVSSSPVDCVTDSQLDSLFAADSTPDDQAEVDTIASESAAVGAGCKQHSPQLAPYLDSVSVARDMDILRAVLGDEKLNYLGKSYGTLLGAWYAQLFPQRVGRVVLDGVLPNSLDGDEISHGQAVAFEASLRRFVEWCITDEDCPLPRDVDQGVTRIRQFLDGLDSAPLPGIGNRPLTEALGLFAVLSHLYFPPSDWVALEYALDEAFQGDGSVLLDLADDRTDRNSDGTYANNGNEAFFAISCLDRPGTGGVDHVQELAASWEQDAPTFGVSMAWGTLPCWQWPFAATVTGGADPNTGTAIHAPGAGPILVVSTRHDMATPYEWGVQVADELESGRLLTYEGDGHTAYMSGSTCTNDAVDAYLLAGTLPAEGTSCPAVPMDTTDD